MKNLRLNAKGTVDDVKQTVLLQNMTKAHVVTFRLWKFSRKSKNKSQVNGTEMSSLKHLSKKFEAGR